ncbi:hypothetical protein ACWKSR_10180, partial [Campylobacter fetus subsp. venerealis]
MKNLSIFHIFKLDLFSFLLVFILIARIFIDRSDLGGIIGVLLIGSFLLFIIYKQKLPKYLLGISFVFTLLIAYAFFNAFYLYNQPIYSLRGVVR